MGPRVEPEDDGDWGGCRNRAEWRTRCWILGTGPEDDEPKRAAAYRSGLVPSGVIVRSPSLNACEQLASA